MATIAPIMAEIRPAVTFLWGMFIRRQGYVPRSRIPKASLKWAYFLNSRERFW
jgi:hypothetical protein